MTRGITGHGGASSRLFNLVQCPSLYDVRQISSKIVRIQARDAASVIAFLVQSALPDLAAGDPLPKAIVWMPAGVHAITAGTVDGETFAGTVIVDEQAARVISSSLAEFTGKGQRVWLDLNHDDGAASADIRSFSWDPSKGIMAHLDWTPRGEKALREKEFSSFSPCFGANRKTGRVEGLVEGHAAGGLVNAPAFKAMPALIAARFGGQPINPEKGGAAGTNITPMNELLLKILAALKITPPANATEADLIALVATHSTNANTEVVDLKAKLATAQKDATDAKTETAAVAVTAKAATAKVAEVEKKLGETDAVVAALKIGVATVTKPDIADVLGAYAASDPCHIPAVKANAQTRAILARERGNIWARDIKPFIKKNGLFELMLIAGEKTVEITKVAARQAKVSIQASNSLGTLSGSLIAQQSLSLLKAKLPALARFTTDFSMENAKLNQSIITRVRGIPTVASYNTSTGYAATGVTDTDVSVSIANHRYSQFQYNANELASTNRDLFAEQAEGTLYAIGKDLVDSVLGLFTAANFYTTPGSPSANAGNGGHTVVTSANWGRPAMINARTALVGRHVYPDMDKGFAIQNPTYYGQLAQDPAIVSLAVFQDSGIITGGQLPEISGILPIEYADLPGNSISLTAIVGTSGSVVIATRLPYDYVDAQIGSNYGAVSQVTDPDTGLSVMLVQYVNHDLGVSNYRAAVMTGYAVGDSTRAQLITSA